MKIEQLTRYLVGVGEEQEILSEAQFEKLVKQAEKDGDKAPVAVKVQTFGVPVAETPEDMEVLSENAEIRVGYYNRGLSLRCYAEVRGFMEDEKSEAVEGVLDLTEIANKPIERRSAAPQDKIAKLFADLSETERTALLQQLASLVQGQAVGA